METNNNYKKISKKVFLYVFLGIYAITVLWPFFQVFLSSFKDTNEIITNPYGLPSTFNFDNYREVFIRINFLRYFFNSSVIFIGSIILLLILSTPAAYALAKYRFRFNNLLYGLFIFGLFIPTRLLSVNILKTIINLHLYDNLLALIIINATFGLPIGIFILTDFIKMVPNELSSSARIDGCSEIGIFLKIILPIIRPAIVTVIILNILQIWNNFWWPLLIIKTEKLKPIPLAVTRFIGEYQTDYGGLFTILNISILPMVIIYLILSRQFVSGITKGAIKG